MPTRVGGSVFRPGRHPRLPFGFRSKRAYVVSVPLPNYPPTPPSESALADILSGVRTTVAVRFQFWQATNTNAPIQDLTEAFVVRSCSIELNNDRPVLRTASFTIRQSLLPANFDYTTSNVAVQVLLFISGAWWRFQLGLFRLDQPGEVLGFEGNDVVTVSASDIGVLLLQPRTGEPFTVAEGTNYITAVESVIDLLGLRHVLPPTSYVTPIDFTWQPRASYLAIANDLLAGINHFPLYADVYGVLRTRLRDAPSDQTEATAYRTTQEPRMVRAPLQRQKTSVRPPNRVIAVVNDPLRSPAAGVAENVDSASPSSTVNVEVSLQEVNVDRTRDTALAADYAAYEVHVATGKGEIISLTTHPDYRRGEHEVYLLTYYDHEDETKWRVASWSLPLGAGAPMEHRLESAPSLSISRTEIVP